MPDNKKKADIKQGDFLSYHAARGNAAPRPSPYQQIVAEKYPNVAESYRPQWDDSDAHLPENEEWKDLLARSVNDLEQAIRICQQLLDNPPAVMTPMTLTRFKNTLLRAIHKTEDVVTEISLSYPTPGQSNYDIAKSDPELAERIPQILLNTEEKIILWIPKVPSKSRGPESIIYQEFTEMLWANTFAHFNKWHCDFIHAYHPTNRLGVHDVDNHYYKPLIDAIAVAITSKDAYDHFSCSFYNFPSEKLKPGCYIHITKPDEKVSDFEHFVVGTTPMDAT